MPVVKVTRHYQVTLPRALRKKLGIVEGDSVEMKEEDGHIILQKVKIIPDDQAYFWTPEWQAGEAEADRDLAEGNFIGPFDKAKDCIKALKEFKE
ncbi:MAG: AbrB/MazE/SpoVT family DNA-binding domain-containing protein [Deltaproteobacteria bacterium]|nr:AbrB/MazE/SpoVT family DNA-binding domain-containing protein [Deltaproteobacteria bacterium]